jgi:hypothetical protein
MLGIAILLGSMAYVNVVYASIKSDNAACREQYLPDDPVGYRICVNGIGTPSTGP